LKTIQNSEDPKIDLLFYGSYTQHRADLIVDFQRNIVLQDSQKRLEIYSKANFVWLFNIDGKDLEKYIADSKIILNLAPYPNSLQQQTRIFHALNNNKCILSEKVKRNYFSNQIVEFEGVQELYTKTVDLLSDDNWKNYTNHI
jgi:hypothetical protein